MRGADLLKMFGTSAAASGGGGGGSGDTGIVLTDTFVSGSTTAYWTVASDGWTYIRDSEGPSYRDVVWINPQIGMNLYEVRADVISGNTPDGTLGSWINCGTGMSWGFTTEYAIKHCSMTVQIRRASDGTVLKSATINIEAPGLA